jgi:hypothetical protein
MLPGRLNKGKRPRFQGSVAVLSGEDVFEAYAENNTSGVYRIFWMYGPEKDVITILAITAHP